MQETIYNTDFINLSLENGIIVVVYKKGPITIDIAKELVEKRLDFCKGKDYPFLLCDEGIGINGMDREAREYMGEGRATEGISATAFYTKSTFNKYLVNFFLRISNKQTNFPVKIYSNKEEAIKWLENFLEKK
ncbi:hypothetical protein N9544_07520 [Flavobacteriales bacterium]|jgi:hypothetical protein|nr:hypothetical protein [Flavobacteriales bacterium]